MQSNPPISGEGRVIGVSLGDRFTVMRSGAKALVQPWELTPDDLVGAEGLSPQEAERKLQAFWD